MFKIRLMRAVDYQFAAEIANTMDWNMAVEDFAFMTSLDPNGCFVAFEDRERIGIATSISYGRVGWFGNLIVKEECRKKGVGSLLVKHSIAYLKSEGVQTIGLYAYPNLVPFYSDLGFEPDEDFSVLHVKSLDLVTAETFPRVEKSQIKKIEAFDRKCFGGDRKKLLESIILGEGNLSHYLSERNGVVGYVAATVYEKMAWVGPLICQGNRVDAAILLVRSVLTKLGGRSVYAVLPKKEEALMDEFFRFGLREDFFVSRMFLGDDVARNCIYMAESLERG